MRKGENKREFGVDDGDRRNRRARRHQRCGRRRYELAAVQDFLAERTIVRIVTGRELAVMRACRRLRYAGGDRLRFVRKMDMGLKDVALQGEGHENRKNQRLPPPRKGRRHAWS